MKLLTLIVLLTCSNLFAKNLHLIQEKSDTGFAIYRTGKLKYHDMKELCRLGVEEIMVLSGNAQSYEERYSDACPTLKVIYNQQQKARIPLTESFLNEFDNWVQAAMEQGKKIAFRCNCGCHRTGRLAAYYQMKYQGLSAKDAKIIMKKHGKWMLFFRFLYPQVDALYDYINNRDCSTYAKYCVTQN